MSGAGRHIVVVGAGLAGLGAAWRLVQRGFEVTLIERDDRAGGRAAVVREEGFAFEAGPGWVSSGDRQLLHWMRESGLGDELLPLRPLVSTTLHRGVVSGLRVRGLADVWRIPGVRAFEALRLARLPRLLSRYAPALHLEDPARSACLDDRSLFDFGRLYFGASVLERWMVPMLTAACLGDPRQMSRAHFLRHCRAQLGEREGLTRAPVGDLLEHVASKLGARLETEVRRVGARRGGGCRVELARGRPLGADAVVVATAACEAARITEGWLSSAERESLERVRYVPGLTLAVALRRPFVSQPELLRVPHAEGSPVETLLVEPGRPGGRAPDGAGLALARARGDFARQRRDAPDAALTRVLLDALDPLRPGLRNAVGRARLLRAEYAVPRFDVGRYREIERFERVQEDRRRQGRRLYFAGDYLVDPSHEGALVSGLRAATALESDLRRDA